ncbi:hypothetical protein HDC92_004491 [Pedobacter sp. AK017]|uniref:glycosyltransferase family 10 domain-containing protein n=1 Tax=Pedobacter sp. AK017 TaxID=2723073 RepID=UPI00162139BC|nr:glycosyltransferase family 10 [Pedobacter sp. AK017]MBB5440787.1 hypothetical protein [Pedobacter sp. AK017]
MTKCIDNENSGCLIVFYNTGFGAPLSFYYPYEILEGTSCEISADRGRISKADAVVFHLPDMGDISHINKRPGQMWILWCQECDQNYPEMLDKNAMSQFDIRMTYHLDSDVNHSYLDPKFRQTFRGPVSTKSSDMLVSMFISSSMNKSGRLGYIRELIKHIKVDSYGKMLRNKKLSSDTGRKSKIETIAKYKFFLAFENACGTDYVTEKFYDAFEAGTVPVYMGADNIEDLSPGEHCYINVNDFANPAALASYLKKLNEDELAYNAYFEWKKHPFKEPFNTLINDSDISLFHRLYKVIKERKNILIF